jgi:hypothetical protein
MILIFLLILVVALVIANVLVSIAKPKKRSEKGFANPTTEIEHYENPEIVEKVENLTENTALIQGSLQATNKKLDMLNQRVSTLEQVLIAVGKDKLGKE